MAAPETIWFKIVVDLKVVEAAQIINLIRAVDDGAEGLEDGVGLEAINDYARKQHGVGLEEYLEGIPRIGKFRWDAVLDDRTGERDRELDGTVWNYNDPASPSPPLHPSCRCKRIPIPANEWPR